jgi:hypothetical protein
MRIAADAALKYGLFSAQLPCWAGEIRAHDSVPPPSIRNSSLWLKSLFNARLRDLSLTVRGFNNNVTGL